MGAAGAGSARSLQLSGEEEALERVFVVLSSVSLALVAPLVLTFLVFKRSKYPSYLVLSFLLCSFGLPLFSLFNAFFGVERLAEGGAACQVQAAAIQLFASGIVWAWFFLGLNLYTIAIWQVGVAKKLGRLYVMLTWAFAAIQTIVPLAAGHMGPAGLWCWVTSDDDSAWEMGFFYGEVGLLLSLGVLLWVRVLYTIVMYSLNPLRGLHGYLLRHALLVTLFVGVMAILFAFRIYQIFHSPPFILQTCQGLITFICFGLSKENYNLWKKAIIHAAAHIRCHLCCCSGLRSKYREEVSLWRADDGTVFLTSETDSNSESEQG